jgi:hypothetical protein
VEEFRATGTHLARETNRAHILAALDRKVPEARIMAVLGVGRTAIWRTRAAYREGGLEFALRDAPRSGKPKRHRTDDEARGRPGLLRAAGGRESLDGGSADRGGPQAPRHGRDRPGDRAPVSKKSRLQPWRQTTWCIGRIAEERRRRMYGLIHLYRRPYRKKEPVACLDEKSKQRLEDARRSSPPKPGAPTKEDHGYRRAGVRNLFVAVEPKGGRRVAEVTGRRAKTGFVGLVTGPLEEACGSARRVHLVLDNLNTHFASGFDDVPGPKAAAALLSRAESHSAPKHASRLNTAEIEIGPAS